MQFALAHALFRTDALAWHLYAFALRLVGGLALLCGQRGNLAEVARLHAQAQLVGQPVDPGDWTAFSP